MDRTSPKIKVIKNGPYMVSGDVPLSKQLIISQPDGTSTGWEEGKQFEEKGNYALCRCGKSKNMPFCDGTHEHIGFIGNETASNIPFFDKAEITEGETLILFDHEELCISARHCHLGNGTWSDAFHSEKSDARQNAIESACNCPAGRLVIMDKQTEEIIEPEFAPSIGIIEDPLTGISGPIWVRGSIPIESAKGEQYEIRNRVTLCRCGKSSNMPFCDGSHISIRFKDE